MADSLQFAYQRICDHISAIQNPVIFELGLCDGFHTKMLLTWCSSMPRYYGFEPDPRNVVKVTGARNENCLYPDKGVPGPVAINPGIGSPTVINFYPHAVGHVTETIPFYLSTPQPDGKTGSSSISEFMPILTQSWDWLKLEGTIQVPCWRLDDFCAANHIDHIDFLWMDVQGAERLVFDGAVNTLPKVKMLWTEYDGGNLYRHSSTIKDILDRFPGWKVLADCGGDVLLRSPL
jgi:2-O-methyltransferase